MMLGMCVLGAAFGALTGPVEFRAIFAGSIEFRPLTKWTITRRAILARTRKARTLFATAILALLPRL